MTKEERTYVKTLEDTNRLLKERLAYLESRLKYEDAVKAVTRPPKNIPM